jgi:hypothetical protein
VNYTAKLSESVSESRANKLQIAFRSLPKDGLDRLKALGFTLTTTLTPERLVLGWLPVSKLEKVAALDFVTRLAPPSYR